MGLTILNRINPNTVLYRFGNGHFDIATFAIPPSGKTKDLETFIMNYGGYAKSLRITAAGIVGGNSCDCG